MMKEESGLYKEVVVIISTRNRVADLLTTIKNCLEIGLGQEQIFITDDASTDGTPDTIRQNFPGIMLTVNATQLGYIRNRNYMMKHSSRRFILSLDDDSSLLSRADLNEALMLLDSRAEYGVFGFIPVEQPGPVQISYNQSKEVFISRWYIGCGHIIKRSTLDAVGLYREEYVFYGEEIDFSIRCYKLGLLVVSKRNLIVHHRVDYRARDTNIHADKNKGEYGILWRSEYAMANKLTHILINYPLVVLPYYLLKSLMGYFFNYVVKNKWFGCYKNALAIVYKRLDYMRKERSPLTFLQFRNYMSLEV
jgi:GT2 family glycosyltransferase